MQVRPFLASAACSAVAAMALVLSEGAMAGAHLPGHNGAAGASTTKSSTATGTSSDSGASTSGAIGGEPTGTDSGSSSDQASTDQSSTNNQAPSNGGVDPGSLVQQVLPAPAPLPIGP